MVKFLAGRFIASSHEARSILQSGFGRQIDKELILHPLEAAYLLGLGLIEIKEGRKKLDTKEILKKYKVKSPRGTGGLPSSHEQFQIFSQLRSGGRVVRFNSHSPHYWRVYAKGVGREQERAQILLRLTKDKWNVCIDSLNQEISVARQLRMELVLAFVEKKQPVFIKINKFNLD